MEIKILTNYDNDLWCVGCKQKIRLLEKFGITYDEDIYGTFEKCYHLDCLPTQDEIE